MSPNERHLRAALHAGEGQPLDADVVIERARTARRQRRTTFAAVGGAVAAVLVVGTGVGLVAANRDGRSVSVAAAASTTANPSTGALTSSNPSAAARTSDAPTLVPRPTRIAPPVPVPSVGIPSPSAVPGAGVVPAGCSARAPRIAAPRGSSAAGPLFPEGITSIRVCVYQPESAAGAPDTNGVAASYLISGSEAQRIATAFNDVALTQGPGGADVLGLPVALLGATATGQVPVVVGTLSGDGTTTNGTATRYARNLLLQLAHTGLPQLGTPGKMSHGPGPS